MFNEHCSLNIILEKYTTRFSNQTGYRRRSGNARLGHGQKSGIFQQKFVPDFQNRRRPASVKKSRAFFNF